MGIQDMDLVRNLYLCKSVHNVTSLFYFMNQTKSCSDFNTVVEEYKAKDLDSTNVLVS